MVGQDGGFGTSDPAMLLAVNPLQWRKSYLVHAPTRWIANYIRASASACTGSRATAATGTRVASTSTPSRSDSEDSADQGAGALARSTWSRTNAA